MTLEELKARLREPAELALADAVIKRGPAIERALAEARYGDVMNEIVTFREPVDRFFTEVMVMVDDRDLRDARLAILVRLKTQILQFADPSAVVQDERQA